MLEDHIAGDPVRAGAEVESIGGVVRLLGRAGGVRPRAAAVGSRGIAAAGAIGELAHSAEVDGAVGEAILHGVIPTGIFGVAASGHGAVVSDVGERVGAAGRIV